jgi:hypothetical protein
VCGSPGVRDIARVGSEAASVLGPARLPAAAAVKRPKLGPWLGMIDTSVEEDNGSRRGSVTRGRGSSSD